MKILVVYTTEQTHLALLDDYMVYLYPLDAMHEKDVNNFGLTEHARESICDLGSRLGLTSVKPDEVTDLAQYLNPVPPFTVDKVLVCGWRP